MLDKQFRCANNGSVNTGPNEWKETMRIIQRIPRALVKAASAGAVVIAAALPLAAATSAGAAVAQPGISYLLVGGTNGAPGQAAQVGQGASGLTADVVLSSTDASNLSSTAIPAAITTTATGVSFTSVSEHPSGGGTLAFAGYYVEGTLSVSASTPTGFYPVTVTDASGSVTIANALYVSAAPTVTAVTPASIPAGATGVAVTVTGTGFEASPTVTFMNSATGATLSNTVSTVSGTAIQTSVSASGATAGTYYVTVTNADGGSVTSSTVGIAVTGPTITSVSPSSLPVPTGTTATNTTTTVTVTGTNFVSGAYVTLNTNAGQTATTAVTAGPTTFVSATSLTVPVTVNAVATTVAGFQDDIVVHLPDGSTGTLLKGLGINEASGTITPTVTSVSATPTMSVPASGSPANTVQLTINGSGFGIAGNTATTVAFNASDGVPDSNVTCPTVNVLSDTQLTCIVNINAGALSGVDSVVVTSGSGNASTAFANALTIAGPTVSSVSPATIPAGYVGSLTFTGVGFPTSAAVSATASDGTAGSSVTIASGTATVASSTSMSVSITGNTGTTAGKNLIVTFTQGAYTWAVAVPEVAPISVSSISYSGTTTDVGVGASAQPVVIVGTGFQPGATLSFNTPGTGSGYDLPTSSVQATVTSISPTAITATVSVSSSAVTGYYYLTVTNTSGGTFTYGNGASVGFNVGAAPVVTKVSPAASVLAGATASTITLYGTGLSSTTTVKSSSPLLTLGTATYNSLFGTLSFTVTAPAITGTSPVGLSLILTNVDGGTTSVSFSINPPPTVTGTYYVPTFSTNYEVAIAGTGFESGMTATSSNSAFNVTVAYVNGTTGTSAVLLVTTTAAATTGTSSNVTLTNPDGSTVTFALNGGSAPVVKPPAVFKVFRVFGVAYVGKTVTIKISGSAFYGQPRITSNVAGVKAVVSGDTGSVLTVRVTASPTSPRGVHTFTVTLANGKSATVNYNQK